MHHYVDPVEPAFEEVLIGLELERVRHDTRGIRDHAILGDDGITFDSTRTGHGDQRAEITLGLRKPSALILKFSDGAFAEAIDSDDRRTFSSGTALVPHWWHRHRF